MKVKKTLFIYYATQRPLTPGAYPTPPGNEPISITNYDAKQYDPFMRCEVYGFIKYPKFLSDKDITDYELKPAIEFITERSKD